jgi:hypothetical protein
MRPFLTFATVFRGAEQLPEFESSPLTESAQYLIPLMAKGGLCSARPDAECRAPSANAWLKASRTRSQLKPMLHR